MVNDWENPALQGRGRIPAHADVIPQPSLKAAVHGERSLSPFLHTLNGAWRFRLYRNPHAVPLSS